MYPPELVAPMSKELTDNGFKGLTTAEEVKEILDKKEGTTLVVVNSVCGCAAAHARPGALLGVQTAAHKPDNVVTVFAGVNKEATDLAREYMHPYPPSSPSMALFKDGQLVHFIERHHIEGSNSEIIGQKLKMALDKYCA